MKYTARNLSLNILTEYEKYSTYPNLSLKKHLRNLNDARDKRFVCALVYGVIEKKLYLDYCISKVSTIKLDNLNLHVLNILRMGFYQFAFMNVPISAACNTSVELAKINHQFKSIGFINAVLRKLSMMHKEIKIPNITDSRHYQIKYSIDPTPAGKIISSLGRQEFEKFMEYNHDNTIYIVVNSLKTNPDELISILNTENVIVKKTELYGLLEINSQIDIENSPAFKNGMFHTVGKSSYLAAKALNVQEGETVFDMCAAPGGKTFSLYNSSRGKAHITAFDIHEHKIKNLIDECNRLGFNDITVKLEDARIFNDNYFEKADKILCDVPCSGLGMILNKPDIKYKKVDYKSLINTQLSILNNASKYLRHNGKIVYSTCTVNKEENYEVIEKFLTNNNNFELDNTTHICENVYGQKLFLPQIDNSDGFYVAVLKRK